MATSLPLTYPLCVYAGGTRPLPVTYKPGGAVADLTGYTASLGVWSAARVLIDVAGDGGQESPVLGITLEIDGPAGTVTATFPAGLEAALESYGPTQYDLIIIAPNGRATPLIRGPIVIEPARPSA